MLHFFLSISVFLLKQIVASHPTDAQQIHTLFWSPPGRSYARPFRTRLHLMHDVRSCFLSGRFLFRPCFLMTECQDHFRMSAIAFAVIQPALHSQNLRDGYFPLLSHVQYYSQHNHYHKVSSCIRFFLTSHGLGRFSICPSFRSLRSLSQRLVTSLHESLLFHSQRLLRSFSGPLRSIPVPKHLLKHMKVNTYHISQICRNSNVDIWQKHIDIGLPVHGALSLARPCKPILPPLDNDKSRPFNEPFISLRFFWRPVIVSIKSVFT